MEVTCAWCGSKGGWANRLKLYVTNVGSFLGECEWCQDKIRRAA
jgi:hypothetical protein